jgi:hypothetical protein
MSEWDQFPAATVTDARKGAAPTKPAAAAKADQRLSMARLARDQLGRVETLYNKSQKGTGLSSLLEYMPWLQDNSSFNAASQALAPLAKGMTRQPGEGAFSDGDQRLLNQSYIPSSMSTDSANLERMRALRQVINNIDPLKPMPTAQNAPAPREIQYDAQGRRVR